MEVASLSVPTDGQPSPTLPEPVDPLIVLEHIVSLIETTLGTARRELEAVGSLLSKANHADSLSKCARFAHESQVALYAQKDVREDLVNGHDGTPSKSWVVKGDKSD